MLLTGCAGPDAGKPNEVAPPTDVTSSQPSAADPGSSLPSAQAAAGPMTYSPPPVAQKTEAYVVAAGVDPAAAKACAALDIGSEVFAAIGPSTLSADSTTESLSGGLLCSFVTADHSASNPNFLAVTAREDSAAYYQTLAVDSAVGWTRQDVTGIGDKARFYESGPTGDQASHMLHALQGSLMVSFLARFTSVPEGADLSVARYGAIADKVFG